MVKKEISSDEKWNEAFWKTALRCVNATHRVTPFSSVFRVLTQFSGNLIWDTSERNEAYGDRGNILRWKLKRRLPRNFLVMWEFISQSYTYVSCNSPLSLLLRNQRGFVWIALRPTLIQDISLVQNVKEGLRNFFVICEFLSQSYILVLRKQFANTLRGI